MPSKRSYFWREILKISSNYNKPHNHLREKLVKKHWNNTG